MNLFALVAKLSLDKSEYEQGLSGAKNDAQSFGSKVGKALGTAGKVGGVALLGTVTASAKLGKTLVNGASEVANYGDAVDKMSQKVGLSAEAYQEWDYVMQISGTEMSSMTTGLKTLTNKLDDAKNGSTDAQEMFARLGFTLEDLNTMSREDVFANTIYGFQQMADSTERAALANDLFGRSGQELAPLFNTSTEDTKALIEQVNELGGVMSDDAVKASADFKDNLTAMQTALSSTKRNIMSETLPAFSDLVQGFTQLISGGEGAQDLIDSGMDKLGRAIDNIMPKIGELLETVLPKILEFGGQLIGSLAQQLPGIIAAIVKQVPTLIKSLIQAITKTIPQLIKAGVEIVKSLAEGIGKGDTDFIDMIIELVDSLITAIVDNLPEFIEAGLTIVQNLVLGIMQKLPELLTSAADIITKLIEGITTMLPQILEQGKDVILSIVHGITQNLPKIIQSAVDIIKSLIDTLVKNLPQILQTGMEILLELIQGLLDAIPDLVTMLPDIIDTIVTTLTSPEMLAKLLDVGVQLIAQLAEGLLDILVNIGSKADEIIGGIVDALLALAGSLLDAGAKLMEKFWEGLKEIAAEIYEWAKNFVDNIKAIFKEAKSISELGDTVMAKANQAQYLASQEYADAVAANRAKYSNTSSSKGYIPTSAQAAMKSAAVSNSSIPSSAREKMGYAKAMDSAYLLDGATIFGAMNGSLLEGGERGQEMIVGTDYLASMIKEAYEQANSGKDQNIIIPVYIGQERITEVVVNAQNRHNYITGGR